MLVGLKIQSGLYGRYFVNNIFPFISSFYLDKLAFLEKNRGSLIKLVTNTMAILDDLKEEGFHSEMISEVAAEKTNEAQMRMILNRIKVQKQAEILFKALAKHEKDILNDLIAKYKK